MSGDELDTGGERASDHVDGVLLRTLMQGHEGKTSALVTLTLLLGQPGHGDLSSEHSGLVQGSEGHITNCSISEEMKAQVNGLILKSIVDPLVPPLCRTCSLLITNQTLWIYCLISEAVTPADLNYKA